MAKKKKTKAKSPELVKVEGRKLVRDMHSKAILNRDVTARNAYLQRRANRRGRQLEVSSLRAQAETQNREIAELKAQLAELSNLVKKKTTTKKTTTRRTKSEDS